MQYSGSYTDLNFVPLGKFYISPYFQSSFQNVAKQAILQTNFF